MHEEDGRKREKANLKEYKERENIIGAVTVVAEETDFMTL